MSLKSELFANIVSKAIREELKDIDIFANEMADITAGDISTGARHDFG